MDRPALRLAASHGVILPAPTPAAHRAASFGAVADASIAGAVLAHLDAYEAASEREHRDAIVPPPALSLVERAIAKRERQIEDARRALRDCEARLSLPRFAGDGELVRQRNALRKQLMRATLESIGSDLATATAEVSR